MANKTPYIRIPFAENGDKVDVNFDINKQSALSFDEGFNKLFELPPNGGGTFINRAEFNYLMYMLSSAIQELQRSGGREYDAEITKNGGYNAGESCLVYYDIYTNKIIKTPPNLTEDGQPKRVSGEQNYFKKIRVFSLTDNNTQSPYEEGAILDKWYIQDGLNIGEAKIDLTNREAPSGYLQVNLSNPTQQFSFQVYKRIKHLMRDLNIGEEFGVFKRVSETSFVIKDLRGHFMRLWSNGSNIDAGRLFPTTQTPALPNVRGSFGRNSHGEFNRASGCFSLANYHSIGLGNWQSDGYIDAVLNLSSANPIYKDNVDDVIPYNFNINLLVKV